MQGYHVIWDAPRKTPYSNWEILLQILSAKMFQQFFGEIHLLCDPQTADFMKDIGVDEIYNSIDLIDSDLLEGIDPKIYFAAGKLAAMLQVSGDHAVFLDTDLLIRDVAHVFSKEVPTVFHREALHPRVYPDLFDYWKMDLTPHKDCLPLNCALTVWPQEELRRNYASHALKFMRVNTYHANLPHNVLMVTAEQRLLGIFFKERGVIPDYFIKDIYVPNFTTRNVEWTQDALGSNIQSLSKFFVHLWGQKDQLRANPIEAAEYTIKLFDLCRLYPELKVETILDRLIEKSNYLP